VALLRSAADKAGCEAVLALADIKTTHSAFKEGYDDYRYGRHWDDDEDNYDDDDDSGDDTRYEIQELIDSAVSLTHLAPPDGTQLEDASLSVGGADVCASTPMGDLEPYSSEYEGYMGNWGNTLDRWYHRAAGRRGDARAHLGGDPALPDTGGKGQELRALRQGAPGGRCRGGRGNRGHAAAPVPY
jgi:hypothetical protein